MGVKRKQNNSEINGFALDQKKRKKKHIRSLPNWTFSYWTGPFLSPFQTPLHTQWPYMNLLVPSLAIVVFLIELPVNFLLFPEKCLLISLQKKKWPTWACNFPLGESLVDITFLSTSTRLQASRLMVTYSISRKQRCLFSFSPQTYRGPISVYWPKPVFL